MRQKIERGLLCIGLVWLLAACGGGGGGGGGSTPAPAVIAPPPTVGASGGTVWEASGASVIVPAGALAADTTIRVAMDSTGAPALSDGLIAAGNTYMVTPHGGSFAVPVEVRIPAPNVTLLPTQVLKLAKAQPGGEWLVLADSTFKDGVLSAEVSSFSYFMPVTVTYLLPIAQQAPWGVVTTTTCYLEGQFLEPCHKLVGGVTANFAWTTNRGQLPAACTAANSQVVVSERGVVSTSPISGSWPTTQDGAVTSRFAPGVLGYHIFDLTLKCGGYSSYLGLGAIDWVDIWYPDIAVVRMPAELIVAQGLPAHFDAVLAGGASYQMNSGGWFTTPTLSDSATVDWQRSYDQGISWSTFHRSYQYEAYPDPLSIGTQWRYWQVVTGLTATAADQGELIRVYACYSPPVGLQASPCVASPSMRLTVILQTALPIIVDAPRAVLVTSGQTASLAATASGAPAPTLQWQTRVANSAGDWANVSSGTGATTGNYTTTALALADNGTQYRVVAMNALGSAQSAPVTVSVSDLDVAPTLTTQPANLDVTVGNDAVFAVAAHGTEALSYLWRFNGVPITGANSPVLRLAAVNAGQAGSYSVDVNNSAGAVSSSPATLVVTAGAPALALPSIVTQPAALSVGNGDTATFAVGSNGTAFQWRKDGVNIASATSAALTLSSVSAADVGVYSVVVSNSAGSVTSGNASLTLTTPPAPVITAPSIITQPATLVVLPGAATTLAVAASGTGPLTYQWSLNGTPISGATGAVLYFPSVTSLDAGNYTVSVGNSAGSAGSNAAQLILVGAPSITAQPGNASVFVGATATFSVTASGNSRLYQWTRNNVAIVGATLASYTTPTLGLPDNGVVYGVIVYNGAGLVFSQGAALTVTPAPVTVGGSVSGITGAGLQLQNNGGDTLAVSVNGTFTFASGIATGTTYAVTVLSQPSGQSCAVQNGSGTANAAVTSVAVTCTSATGLALVANSSSNSLSIFRVDSSTGVLTSAGAPVATGQYPFSVAVTPNGQFAYLSNLVGGTLSSYSIDKVAGVLTPIPLSSPGTQNPFGIAMDPLGRYLWVANYSSHTVSAFAINTGTGVLAAVGLPLATGGFPYALAVHPSGNFVYLANETGNSVMVFSVNAGTGALTLVPGTIANSVLAPHAIAIDPSGRFAYASSNGSSSGSAFSINQSTGVLTAVGWFPCGASPESVVVHPNGAYAYVANQGSNTVSVFAINQTTGALTTLGSPIATGSGPTTLAINTAGSFLYVTNQGSNSVSAFNIVAGGASLTSFGAAVPAGSAPVGIALTP